MNEPPYCIIWDWNGTLLADVDICINAMNMLLEPRNLPLLDYNRYREIFTFPVINYYAKAGFDFELDPFSKVGIDFIDIYHQKIHEAGLAEGATEILEWFHSLGIRQFILSAMEQQSLQNTVHERGIIHYFTHLAGIDNHYGGGKTGTGIGLFANHQINKDKTWLIGDTIHDFEVSQSLGCKCVLTAHGHQSKKVLETTGAPVLDNLRELKDFFMKLKTSV